MKDLKRYVLLSLIGCVTLTPARAALLREDLVSVKLRFRDAQHDPADPENEQFRWDIQTLWQNFADDEGVWPAGPGTTSRPSSISSPAMTTRIQT